MPLFGRRKKDEGADAPDRAWRRALRDLAAARAGRAAADTVAYVLDGRDPAVLTAIARTPSALSAASAPKQASPDAVRTFYAGFAAQDPQVLRRWARVLDADPRHRHAWGFVLGALGGHRWHELMIREAAAATPAGQQLPVTFDDVVRIAATDGLAAADVLRACFEVPAYARYARGDTARVRLPAIPGFATALGTHRPLVASLLTSGPVDARAGAARLVGETLSDDGLAAFAEPLAEAATGTSGQVRDAARAVLRRAGDAAAAPLRTLATDGKPDQRAHALALLAERPDDRAWALETAAADRAASVRAVATQLEAASARPAADDRPVPDLPTVDWAVPPDEAARVARAVYERYDALVDAHNRQFRERALHRVGPKGSWRPLPRSGRGAVDELAAVLASDAPPEPARIDDHGILPNALEAAVDDVVESLRPGARTTVKTMLALGLLSPARGARQQRDRALTIVHAHTGEPDLLTLQAMLDGVGAEGWRYLWESYACRYGSRLGRGWPDEHVWPFVARNLDGILEESARTRDEWWTDDHALFAAVATLPEPPARLVEHLYELALGARKSDRAAAQAALAKDPDRVTRACAALQGGKGEVRQTAAQWLGRIGDASALPALRAAWRTERQDVVRGALLDALDALGEDPADYLDPATTLATAEKAVRTGLPAALAWLGWDAVPQVRWASSGEVVPRAVVQWLCATAVKARSPEPDAVLRHYADLLDPADRERLAAHLLSAWLHEDLRPVPPDEAERQARAHASANHRWMTSDPEGRYAGLTVEQLTHALLPGYLRRPAGSAAASKGLLAVVAACGGRDVVPPAEAYLREWYGQRAAQGKALLAMLSWVRDPAATQLVLSVGSRFRTKSFQDEATRLAHALAERRGWTVDELADRTIPTAGFDAAGVLELPYGSRTFTARLLPDLAIELRGETGKVLRGLPVARKADDPELVKAAKKALVSARKEVRSVAALQQARLYEALCTERSWSVEEWERHLLRHPLVGPAVRRLVWVASPSADPGCPEPAPVPGPVTFRPLDDGSLTDVDDEPVELPAAGRVRLAHDSLLDPGLARRWVEHLADYEVTPLFEQLGRGLHELPADAATRRAVTDHEGHLVQAYALRSRALALGYVRGGVEDAGWFYGYDKRFPTLGLVARVEFTGNFLPEEDRTVALRQLTFHRVRDGADGPLREVELALADVPAVLLSECRHDLRALAAVGTGFDADWQQKTEY